MNRQGSSSKKRSGRSFLVLGLVVLGVVVIAAAGGGWWLTRPPSRMQPKLVAERSTTESASTPGDQAPGGRAEVPEEWSQALAQVAETMKTAPQKLSPYAKPEPFDAEEFARNPERYLSKIEPARCFQSAKPGREVPPLDVAGSLRSHINWGDTIILWTKTVPNAPVTYTIFGGGHFKENGVGTVSLRADARGLAGAHYTADPNIVGDISVVAASPLASGTQRFFIGVGPQTASK